MKEQIIEKLKKSEGDLEAYENFRKDPTVKIEDRNAVAFAHLFELFAFTTLHGLVPEYLPSRSTQIQLAQALGGTRGYVSVVDGDVVISPAYYEFLKMAQEMKTKKG